tara:strand:- start:407 stop:1741 length:1335 start_codon:yes stop_codon:yes gene_type:complete
MLESVGTSIFTFLTQIDDFFWSYIGFLLVVLCGFYLTLRSRFFQFKVLMQGHQSFKALGAGHRDKANDGVNPIKLFFSSVGGMIGLGNIVAVVSAVSIGGPGALFWLWIAAIAGMVIKYSEIYLGIRFREKNNRGSYDGGPMYYLRHAFKTPFLKKGLPILSCLLLCIYGVEIYQFVIIADTVSRTFEIEKLYVVLVLLVLTFYAGLGGVRRLANICTALSPLFILSYIGMCLWVIIGHIEAVPDMLAVVIKSAFSGHAPIGGFAGSSLLLAAQHGISRGVYTGDIAIGYDSIIQSETRIQNPATQARMAVFGILSDSFFCTMSIMVVLLTGIWHDSTGLLTSQYVASALGQHFPYVDKFMVFFIFVAGWTTIVGYLAVGGKAARFLSPKKGFRFFMTYAVLSLFCFSFFNQSQVLLIMSLSGGGLMLMNLTGILKLRHEIKYQ